MNKEEEFLDKIWKEINESQHPDNELLLSVNEQEAIKFLLKEYVDQETEALKKEVEGKQKIISELQTEKHGWLTNREDEITQLKQEVEYWEKDRNEINAMWTRRYNSQKENEDLLRERKNGHIEALKQEVEELKRNSQEDYKSGFANGEKDAIKEITQLKQQLEESKRENEAYKNTLKEVYRILPRKDCNQKVLSIISKDNF